MPSFTASKELPPLTSSSSSPSPYAGKLTARGGELKPFPQEDDEDDEEGALTSTSYESMQVIIISK